MTFSPILDPLALEGGNTPWLKRTKMGAPQGHVTHNSAAREILNEIKHIRTLRNLRNNSTVGKQLTVVPQARDPAGMTCSSQRCTKGAQGRAHDALLCNVASRLEDRQTHIQLYWFLWWRLERGRPKEAETDFQIVEGVDGLPLYSSQSVGLLWDSAQGRVRRAAHLEDNAQNRAGLVSAAQE